MKLKKLAALFLIIALVFSFAGCNGGTASENTEAPAVTTPAGTAPSNTKSPDEGGDVNSIYPVADTPVTITGWGECPPAILNYVEGNDLNNIANIMLAQEATNIHVEWIVNADRDKFMIMLSGDDAPDILTYAERNYSGGRQRLLTDGVCVDLIEYAEECAPDWYNFYLNNDSYASKISTGDGGVATMFGFRDYIDSGTVIRKDWLDDLGMEIPRTYDELTEVLRAFVNEKGADMGASLSEDGIFGGNAPGWLTGGYGVNLNDGLLTADVPWQVDENGTVHMSYTMEGTYEYLSMVREWYKEGIVNSDMFSLEATGGEDSMQLLFNDKCGFTWMSVTALAESTKANAVDPNFELVAMADLTKNVSDTIKVGGRVQGVSSFGGSVSADSEHIEEAIKYLNWFWTEEGSLASNFGVESETYHYDNNGDMYWDDLIGANPNGLALKTAQYAYVGYVGLGFNMEYGVMSMAFSNDAQREAQDIWVSNRTDDYLYYGSMTAEEAEVYSLYASEMKDYIVELTAKYISGAEPLENFWSNLNNFYDMGLQQMIDAKQAAYDRYLSGK